MRRRVVPVVLLLALAAVGGCATAPYRAHPEFEARARLLKTVALMPPDVKVYRLTAGGVRELMDEWSDKARANLVRSVAGRVGAEGRFVAKELGSERSPAVQQELQDVRALFEAVASSVFIHAYRPETTFETKAKRFDYSLGPLPTLAEAAGADALLFVYAVDHISTGGRVALNVMTVLLGAAAGVVIIPAGGQTTMVTALVDARTGDLLWFNVRGSGGAHDLRDPASAESLATEVFREFGEIAGAGRRGTGG